MAGEELCQECGARVASIKMKIHMKVNHDKEDKKFKDCNLVCVRKKSFYIHIRNHIKRSCKYCSQDISKSQLSQHMKICTKMIMCKPINVNFVHLKVLDLINRPGVARAVLQSASSLTH